MTLQTMRPAGDTATWRARATMPDAGALYHGGVHPIDLGAIEPMVATPGDADRGIPSDPTNGARVQDIGDVRIDIAYGGSCTAGKHGDMDLYARVARDALAAGKHVAGGVDFLIQYGSAAVEAYAQRQGYVELFQRVGIRLINKGRSGPGSLWLASPLTLAASAFEGRIAAWQPGMWSSRESNA